MSVFYLKYRPQKISELDLGEIREDLGRLLASRKVPHALLFAGPKGSGKTSSARIIAKAINCLNRSKSAIEPCNRCKICKSITNGTALDLIEIDAASNRGIDDIRNLREKIKFTPTEAKYKVYVVDECHMLTTPAFNALLKTLEEPPEHAVFILCTTRPQALPETITSRCLRFDFKKAQEKEISRSLKRIIKAEKLRVEEGVLEKIAKISDGSFRDASKILEQLSFKKGKISLADVKEEIGLPQELLNLLVHGNLGRTLSWIEKQAQKGTDWPFFIKEMLGLLHQLLLSRFQLAEKPVAVDLDTCEIKCLIKILEQAALQTKTTEIPQLPLEMAVIDWYQKEKVAPTSTKASAFGSTESASGQTKSAGKTVRKGDWEKVLRTVKPLNHSVEALLRSAQPKEINGNQFMIEVFYQFHKGKLESKSYKDLVEKTLEKVFGRSLKVCYTLRE